MGSTSLVGRAARDTTHCRPAEWTDVLKFFLLNYGLHALTVVSTPGDGSFQSLSSAISALLFPYMGMSKALFTIFRGARFAGSPLEQAARAGALCMIIPPSASGTSQQWEDILPLAGMTTIHGQIPTEFTNYTTAKLLKSQFARGRVLTVDYISNFWLQHSRTVVLTWEIAKSLMLHPSETWMGLGERLGLSNESSPPPATADFRLVRVPIGLAVEPLILHGPVPEISCNYSMLKTLAAVAQIVYGILELYHARGRQLQKYGYAAYSLTVVPYVMMSLVNCLAAVCEPQYPAMYIVYYRTQKAPQASESLELQPNPQSDVSQPEGVTGDVELQDIRLRLLEQEISGAVGNAFVSHSIENDAQSLPAKSFFGALAEKTPSSVRVFFSYIQRLASVTENSLSAGLDIMWLTSPLLQLLLPGIFSTLQACLKSSKWSRRISLPILIFGACLVAAPYVILKLLTNFDGRQSTVSQRVWVMVWLALGQFFGIIRYAVDKFMPKTDNDFVILIQSIGEMLVVAIPCIGGFVVVGRMIAHDEVCVKV